MPSIGKPVWVNPYLGNSGASKASGASGTSGTNGTNGTSGASGASGTSGTSGVSGTKVTVYNGPAGIVSIPHTGESGGDWTPPPISDPGIEAQHTEIQAERAVQQTIDDAKNRLRDTIDGMMRDWNNRYDPNGMHFFASPGDRNGSRPVPDMSMIEITDPSTGIVASFQPMIGPNGYYAGGISFNTGFWG